MSSDDDILKDARQRFSASDDAWSEAKATWLEDYNFARMSEQWPTEVQQARKTDGRPCHTINRMNPMIRQVVNDGRENRPSIKVRAADSGADLKTAEIMGGIIRHIEATSDADVAYDTALDNSCSGGFGFVGVDIDYAHSDTFERDIKITAFPNPLAVSWDADTEAADSSDWEYGFVSENMDKDDFEAAYPGRESSLDGFNGDAHLEPWYAENKVQVSRYYLREEIERKIVQLSDGTVVGAEEYAMPENKALFDAIGLQVVQARTSKSYQITLRLITGKDILQETKWAGSIIPIIPCWGDQLNVEGKRYFHSLIYDAKDAQRMFNYSRTTATEVTSLAPRVPFMGEQGVFDPDIAKWGNINSKSYPYIEYKKGMQPPQRPTYSPVAEGAMAEAMAALDDIKHIVGIHDASLGVPGNEISGKAIRYRQHEGDVSTFHFIDNQHRMIRCVGRVCLELIPHVYSGQRIIRILGVDGKAQNIALAPTPPQMPGQPPMPPQPPPGYDKAYDITAGKYDLVVEAGPSYTTQREETADMMTDFLHAAPQAAPILGPMLLRMSNMPEAEKVSDMLATMMPPAARAIMTGVPLPPPGPPQPPPEVQEAMARAQADIEINKQKAAQEFQLSQAKAAQEAQDDQRDAMAHMALDKQKNDQALQLTREKHAMDLQMVRERAQADIEVMKLKAAAEIEIKRNSLMATPASVPLPQ